MLRNLFLRLLPAGTIAGLVLAPALIAPQSAPVRAQGTPGLMEFRWDTDRDYRKLYYYLTSTLPDERATWYLTLRAKDRKTAILKLTITVPDYFDSKLKPHRISLCRTTAGSMMSRTKCKETIPAVIEVNKDQTEIVVFPDTPLPADGDYSVWIKLFNPTGKRMYQFNALVQAPGDDACDWSGHLGSATNTEIEVSIYNGVRRLLRGSDDLLSLTLQDDLSALQITLSRSFWQCEDRPAGQCLVTWSDFMRPEPVALHAPVRCRQELTHHSAGSLVGRVLAQLRERIGHPRG